MCVSHGLWQTNNLQQRTSKCANMGNHSLKMHYEWHLVFDGVETTRAPDHARYSQEILK